MDDAVDDHEETQGALFPGPQQVPEKRGTHRPRQAREKTLKPPTSREPSQRSESTVWSDPKEVNEPPPSSNQPRIRSGSASLRNPQTLREPFKARDKRRPINIPHDPTESQLHQSVAELLDWILKPPTFYTTFPAGWGRLSKGTAGRLFASGLKKGMPDILVFDEGPKVVGIELKAGRNTVSAAQRSMFAQLQAVGITVYVCRSQEDVRAALYREFIDIRTDPHNEREPDIQSDFHAGTHSKESLR